MINLLFPADQKAIRAEYRHRLFVVGGLLTFGLALIALIIVGSFAFILAQRHREVSGQITAAREQFASSELDRVRRGVEQANAAAKILAVAPTFEPVTTIYQRLIDKRVAGIQLTQLAFSIEGGGKVEVSGKSPTRAALMTYLETLRTDDHFRNVESPVKNIIRERDVAFNLTVTLAPSAPTK